MMKRCVLALLAPVALGQDIRIVSTPVRHVVAPPSRAAAAGVSAGAAAASSGLSDASARLLETLKRVHPSGGSAASVLENQQQTDEDAGAPSNGGGGGGRKLLARLQLTNTGADCFNGVGPCEAPPVLLPASGYGFNHAGAVSLLLGRAQATVRYTLDGSEPDRHTKGYIADNVRQPVVHDYCY
jgi:hypothetical protein